MLEMYFRSKNSRVNQNILRYSTVAQIYEKMEGTTKRLELIGHLVELILKTPKEIIDKVVYLTQGKLYPDFMGVEIGVAEKLAIRVIALVASIDQKQVESSYKKTGDMGTTAEQLLQRTVRRTQLSKPLTLQVVYESLDRIANTSGQGSLERKLRLLSSLLNESTPKEAKYLMRTVMGQLRLGIADYTVLDALAVAYTGDKANRIHLERAYNLSSDLGAVAKRSAEQGLEGVNKFQVTVGKPIRPMLAERMETAKEIVEKLGGKCAVEYKLDGERLQIHKNNAKAVIFSRRLENITNHYPDAVEATLKHVRARDAILEAEVVAVNFETGEYLPFQELMHRRRKYGIEEAMKQYPTVLNYFDLLYADGADYTAKSYMDRRKALEKIVETNDVVRIVTSIVTDDPGKIEDFMQQAIVDGCEGLLIKDLNSVYRAGAREFSWIKLKREYRSELTDTIDLVIVGAFYGRGRRAGKYGTFLLSSYDKETGRFPTATKIGTGFTDDDLDAFPKLLKPHQVPSKYPTVDSALEADVWFRPGIVIETIASEITLSPTHLCGMNAIRKGSGLALRFPKFTSRIRNDKAAEDATSVSEIIQMYKRQLKRIGKAPPEVEPL